MTQFLTKFTPITKAATAATLVACGGSPNLPNDDLGYDPAIRDIDAALVEVFDAQGLPTGAAGAPLRAIAVEGDWATHLGNAERTGTRLAPGIEEPVIRWSAEVGIQGYANTPLVDDERVYVSSQGSLHNQGDSEDGFYAIDAIDGSHVWFYPTNEDINGSSLTADFVVGGSDDGTLYAIGRTTGEREWEIELGSPIHHGPLVDGDVLRVQLESGFMNVNARDGRTLHRSSGEPDSYDVRGSLSGSGADTYRVARACSLAAYSGDSESWSRTTCTPSSEEWQRASVYGPAVVIGGALLTLTPISFDYEGTSLSLGLYERDGGAELWTVDSEAHLRDDTTSSPSYDSSHMAASPWLMNGVVFVPRVQHSDLVGFDLATGQARLRVWMPDCRARQFASIVGVPSIGYYARHDGHIYAFRPLTGEIAWTMSLQYHATASVIPTNRLSWTGDRAYCSGDPWDGSPLFSTPAIGTDGTLYVGSGEGWLYAIEDTGW
jgi:outer membrane protein assembly factor BamB